MQRCTRCNARYKRVSGFCMWPQTRQMKESTKPRIGRMLGGFAVSGMDKVEVRRCEELARQAKPPAPPSLQTLGQQGRWGRRFRLPGRPEANFSQLLSAGMGFAGKTVLALSGKTPRKQKGSSLRLCALAR